MLCGILSVGCNGIKLTYKSHQYFLLFLNYQKHPFYLNLKKLFKKDKKIGSLKTWNKVKNLKEFTVATLILF